MRRNLWKKVTSATLCAAMVGGIMVSNGALAVQAEEGGRKGSNYSQSHGRNRNGRHFHRRCSRTLY